MRQCTSSSSSSNDHVYREGVWKLTVMNVIGMIDFAASARNRNGHEHAYVLPQT